MQTYDRFGRILAIGDRVEFFRVAGGSTGGNALGWTGGMKGTIRELGGQLGSVLIEHDKRTAYAAPYDVEREWGHTDTVVKIQELGSTRLS